MINDQDFLHGAAFLRLINSASRITISHAFEIHQSIKHSVARVEVQFLFAEDGDRLMFDYKVNYR
jgi:hypothetical protein